MLPLILCLSLSQSPGLTSTVEPEPVVYQPIVPLLVAGGLLFSASYVLTIATFASTGDPLAISLSTIPLVGPIAAGFRVPGIWSLNLLAGVVESALQLVTAGIFSTGFINRAPNPLTWQPISGSPLSIELSPAPNGASVKIAGF